MAELTHRPCLGRKYPSAQGSALLPVLRRVGLSGLLAAAISFSELLDSGCLTAGTKSIPQGRSPPPTGQVWPRAWRLLVLLEVTVQTDSSLRKVMVVRAVILPRRDRLPDAPGSPLWDPFRVNTA